MTVKLHGFDEYMKLLDDIVPELMTKTEKAFQRIGNAVEGEAKRLAPVGTQVSKGGKSTRGGGVKQSITHEVTRDGDTITGAVGTNKKYAVFVELGTEGIINANNAKTTSIEAISRGKYTWDTALDPKNPITDWQALRNRGGSGQSMPFLRTAIANKQSAIDKELKDIGK